MIEINHLVKKYGDHIAVDDLSLSIKPGKIYGFLGPNGAGKSTTMNIITGYIGATSGEVKIDGHDIFEEPEEAKKCIGYLPELPPLYQEMTVGEYLKFVAELKRIPKKERKQNIAEVMELTKISDMENRMIRNLSKGYKQRVGLAQAILGYPDVIILDEPTVGLDPKQIIEVRELIKNLGQKHTIILSSHIMQEVSAVCDYIFIINKGKLVAGDTPENLANMSESTCVLTLVIKGDIENINSILDEYEEILSYEVNPVDDTENCKAVITTESGVDLREALFFRFAENKMAVLENHIAEKTLEDVFIELTSESPEETSETAEIKAAVDDYEAFIASGADETTESQKEVLSDDSDL
ncbi:MAG: ABC transporter ATP-binding protein [Eubacterium sp.]